jgi:Zn-dependent peptidase ImmA (M78 family)
MSILYARRIIKDRNITDPRQINLLEIAISVELKIQEKDVDGCDGILQMIPEPKCGVITVRQSIREPGQKRFVVAHEIGHFEDSNQLGQNYECGAKELSFRSHQMKPEEVAANEFAAELLMPEQLFKPRIQNLKPNMDLIRALTIEYQTTLTATLRRFIAFTEHRCAMVYSVDGKVEYCIPTADFNYRIVRRTNLHTDSFAIDFFKGGSIEDKMHSVYANAWIKGDRISNRDCIQEHSIAQPSYNAVLTLLWINQDIDGFYTSDDDEREQDLDHFTPDGKRWRW